VVTYDVADSSGNPATGLRTVNVVDTAAPVITLVGANPLTVEVGGSYSELGATAADDYDGDITDSIVIDASAVNVSVLGSYLVTYDVTDSSGNAATRVTRTVDVVDRTVPVITLSGANPQTVDVGDPYPELGATAADNYDGDITGLIVIDASAVDTHALGSYVVSYDVTDREGNPAIQVTRTVNVVDRTVPVITLSGVNPQTIEVGGVYSELGATAADNYDGDITGLIVIDASAVDSNVVGSYVVTYNVSDREGNPAIQVTRAVNVVDTTAPIITLNGSNPQTITFGSLYPELGATASDSYDGDITGSIVIDASAVDTSALGSYAVTYDVTDSGGNAATQVTRTVNVVNGPPTLAPVADQSGDEGSAIAFTATATDSDPSEPLTFSLSDEPAGAAISPTGDFSWTPTEAQGPGIYSFDVVVTDGGTPGLSDSQTISVSVTEVNQAPVLGTLGPYTVDELAPLTFRAAPTDLDLPANPLSYTLVDAPAGATIDPSTGQFSWVPIETQGPGSYTFDVRVDDNGTPNLSDTTTVTVNVGEVNAAPMVTNPGNQASSEDEPVTLTIAAVDPDDPVTSLTYAAAGLPDGLTIDSATGTIAGTITASAAGGSPYAVTVTVSDSGFPSLATSVAFTWTVARLNSAPILASPGTQQTAEGEAVTLQIDAVDPDSPPDSLYFVASGLPEGLAIDPATGVISGVPSFDSAAGSPYLVKVTVSDSGSPQLTSQVVFPWDITNTNRPPTALDITVYARAGVPAPVVLAGSDPDGDPLTFAVTTSPELGSLVGESPAFDYTAPNTASGWDSFTYGVSDGAAQASGTVTIRISPNLPPVGGPDRYVVRWGGTLVVEAPGVLGNDRDPEGEPLRATIDSEPEHGTLRLDSDGLVVYTHAGDDATSDKFTYRISDGARISEPVTVTILIEANIAPTAVPDAVELEEDSQVVFYPLSNDSDRNGDAIRITGVFAPQHGTLSWGADGSVSYRPFADWNGEETISYVITDGDLSATGQVVITVTPVNDPPQAQATEAVGHSGSSVVVDLRSVVFDIDNDPLTFTLQTPSTAQISEIEPGVFEIELDGVVRDLPPLTFLVTDPAGSSASSSLLVSVRIPASLIGVPALVRSDLDDSSNPLMSGPDSAEVPSQPVLAGLRLMVGSVLDTFRALRLPLLAVLVLALVSLYVGFNRRFAFSSTPTSLPMTSRRRVDIVMAPSGAGVSARSGPGVHQSVHHRFGPSETGIIATGSRAMLRGEVWVEVETPDGDAWLSSTNLTEHVSETVFSADERPRELAANLIERIYSSDDLQPVTNCHDLHVAFYGPPVRFAASSLAGLLRGASVYSWWQPEGDTPHLQGTFSEVVGESITAAYRNQDARPSPLLFPVPRELANLHNLLIGTDDYGDGWRIFFRYEDGAPAIAGLVRDAAANPAAVHGRLDMQV
jgi:hypothetical protein